MARGRENAARERESDGRRRSGALLALLGSAGVHLTLFVGIALPSPSPVSALPETAPGEVIDIAIPGLGPPGAPAGESPTNDDADEIDEDLEVPVAPPPRARTHNREAEAAAPEAASEPDEVSVGVEATPSSGTIDGHAFVDSLIARSTGSGAGAGGNGGAGCPDPIAGTWFVRKFRRGQDWWTSFTLKIARDGDTLSGRVVNHGWTGHSDTSSPPRCSPGIHEHRVNMDAEGFIRGDQVRFEGVGHPQRTILCMGQDLGYNLDRFTGTVRGNRILAVNNDGGYDVNEPYVFRRTSCE